MKTIFYQYKFIMHVNISTKTIAGTTTFIYHIICQNKENLTGISEP